MTRFKSGYEPPQYTLTISPVSVFVALLICCVGFLISTFNPHRPGFAIGNRSRPSRPRRPGGYLRQTRTKTKVSVESPRPHCLRRDPRLFPHRRRRRLYRPWPVPQASRPRLNTNVDGSGNLPPRPSSTPLSRPQTPQRSPQGLGPFPENSFILTEAFASHRSFNGAKANNTFSTWQTCVLILSVRPRSNTAPHAPLALVIPVYRSHSRRIYRRHPRS